MLLGLLHKKRSGSVEIARKTLASMAGEAGLSKASIMISDHKTVHEWKCKIKDYYPINLIKGIMIFDELVPVPIIRNEGCADNIYGNLTSTDQWIMEKGGWFPKESFPLSYSQDAWVARWIPCSLNYHNSAIGRALGYKLDYSAKLVDWYLKNHNPYTNPRSSLAYIVDPTDSISNIHLNNIDKYMHYHGEIRGYVTSPVRNQVIASYYDLPSIGTILIYGNCNAESVGDFTARDAFYYLKEGRGPTVIMSNGCILNSDGSFNNLCFASNILNSYNPSNVRCVIGGGITHSTINYDTETGGRMSLFFFMASQKYFGEALRLWIQNEIHYFSTKGDIESCLNAVALSVMGNPCLKTVS